MVVVDIPVVVVDFPVVEDIPMVVEDKSVVCVTEVEVVFEVSATPFLIAM